MKLFVRPWYKKKKFIVPVSLLMVLLVVRMVLPSIILQRTNHFLAEASPVVDVHCEDLDLSFFRGAIQLEGITASMKKDGKKILVVDEVEASIAWRELFRGRFLAEVDIEGVEAFFRKNLLDELKKTAKKEPTDPGKKIIDAHLASVDVKNMKVVLEDYPGFGEGPLVIKDITTRVSNVTPTEKNSYAFINFEGELEGVSKIKASGSVNLNVNPVEWDIDGEMRGFDLTVLNDLMKGKIPLTVTRGNLSVYAEARSEEGQIEGYIKPFMKNMDVIKQDEDFKGPKHVLFEIGSALGNLVLRNSDAKTFATRIPFEFDKKLKIDTGEALEKAIQHGFEEKLQPGIENKYEIQ